MHPCDTLKRKDHSTDLLQLEITDGERRLSIDVRFSEVFQCLREGGRSSAEEILLGEQT